MSWDSCTSGHTCRLTHRCLTCPCAPATGLRQWDNYCAWRLALVPLGHLSGRLPLGNPGRSTVSAFEPLPVRPELAEMIARARGN
jgi:hypothetical protein